MSADTTNAEQQLLALYDRVADAPDAIQRLRSFVLDLTVRGKLVEQSPDDEPASELAKRIKEEKERLAKEGEFREPRNAVEIRRENLPFVPPSHWVWCRLIEIARPSYGCAFKSSQFNKDKRGMPLIRIRDISKTDTEAYYEGEYDPAYLVRAGDYLVGMDGDFNLRKWEGPDGLLNQRVMRINSWRCGVEPEFVKLPLQIILDYLHGDTSLTTVKHLSAKQVNGIEIPLPPLAEQHRIVAKVEELMALLDRLEATRTAAEFTRDRLTVASLSRFTAPDTTPGTFPAHARFALDALPSITTRADQIQSLRQTILNLAVRGKLVEQVHKDESALKLLEQIKEHRQELAATRDVRKRKPVEPLDDEDAMNLPVGWAADALANLIDPLATVSYGVLVPGPNVDRGIPFVRAQDLMLAGHPEKPSKAIAPDVERKYTRTRLNGGEILLCVVGSIGKLGVAPMHWAGANIARAVARISPVELIDREFLLVFLRSDRAQSYFEEATRTLAQPTLNVGLIEKLSVPLPPLAEQNRIVAKVDELMALCDRLEATLTTADAKKQRLLEALLHKALAGNISNREAA